MLGGEDFCRSHEAGLITIIQGDQHAHNGYQCFPASHIALEQPVHLFSRSAVLTDFPDYPLLGFGQLEGKVMVIKGIEIITDHLKLMPFKISLPLVF